MIIDKKKINYRNVTDELYQMESDLTNFLSELDNEKKYFNLTISRLMSSKLVIIAEYMDQIIGLAGLESKYGIVRNFIILKQKFHGIGIGKDFSIIRANEAKKLKHNIIMSVIEENNIAALKMNYATGYRLGGKRGNLYYIFKPLNLKGVLQYYCIKFLFPLARIIDKIRR